MLFSFKNDFYVQAATGIGNLGFSRFAGNFGFGRTLCFVFCIDLGFKLRFNHDLWRARSSGFGLGLG
jgi:hypothetical protein